MSNRRLNRVRIALVCGLVLDWQACCLAGEPSAIVGYTSLIDSALAEAWREAGVTPTSPADDATFLRRASLDLVGRVPTAAEARRFLHDDDGEKRARAIECLVASGAHARHMATFWRRSWMPQADTAEFSRLSDDFERWVTVRLQDRTPYDELIRELLTIALGLGAPGAFSGRQAVSPVGFYAASEGRVENLAASATRGFLGVNLDCAQCHDHPSSRWTRDQFWKTAAFFADPRTDAEGVPLRPAVLIPDTNREVSAELIDGTPLQWPHRIEPATGRGLLAEWLTARTNPYFARNAVNRIWAHLFGRGLVEPLDDLSSAASNTGFQAELLAAIADRFVRSDYDLDLLVRGLASTRLYQSSAPGPGLPTADPAVFASMPVRGLTGEQLYDSLRTAAGLPLERDDTGRGRGLEDRKQFASRFRVLRPGAAERSITQALAMMNSPLTAELTNPDANATVAAVAGSPFMDPHARVEALFLATLGREPTADQVAGILAFTSSRSVDAPRAYADVFWALINSSEFNTNH